MAVAADAILAAMLALPQYHGDRHADTPEDRARLYRPVAEAISAVAANRTEAAALVALGYHETAFARYVLDGYCYQGPVGARCDGGRARGAWQVWSWCRPLWDVPETAPSRHLAGARCAVRRLRSARADCARVCRQTGSGCRPHIAAFSGYAGRGCDWPGATGRVKTMARIEAALRRAQ